MGAARPGTPALGVVLDGRRRDRFVGRRAELSLVRDVLEAGGPPSVLYVHGPGGIGKTHLLLRIAELAERMDRTVVHLDARDIPPEPPAVLTVLSRSLDVPGGDAPLGTQTGQPLVLLVDTYERLAGIDDWVRDGLLPRLPATALTVLAGRHPPAPGWRGDAAWDDLLRVVSLRNLTPAESGDLLALRGIDPSRHDEIVAAAHGHPLGLSLLADLVRHGRDVRVEPLPPDLVHTLLQRFVATVPTDLHRRALQVCALARVTNEHLLRAALDVDDAAALFGWLREQSFIELAPGGIHPHELVRDTLDADLRWRDPQTYAVVFHGVWRHVRSRVGETTGREQLQAVFDLKYVFRNLPGVLSPVDWQSWGELYPVAAAPSDRDAVVDLIRTAEGEESASLAAAWFDRQPGGFFVLRYDDGGLRGVIAIVDVTAATEQEREQDPGVRAVWDHVCQHGRPRPGDVVTQTRFIVDAEAYQDPSPTLNATPVITTQQYVQTPRLAWDFLTLAEPDRWNDYFAAADLPRADGADFEMGDRRFGLFAHNFRRVPVDAWLQRVTERALTRQEPAEPDRGSMVLLLSQPDFDEAARQALRDLRHPNLLSRNVLLRTGLLRDRAEDAEPDARTLETLLRDAVDTLGDDPRDDKLLRAVDRTYLRPSGTQEAAAARLGLPFSTYRRHLTRGVARVVAWMWDQELYGPDQK